MTQPLTCCPFCQGISGYRNKEVFEYERQRDWGDTTGGEAEYMGVVSKSPRLYCINCGKNVSAALNEPRFKL